MQPIKVSDVEVVFPADVRKDLAQETLKAVEWCQQQKVSIDCSDGEWDITSWTSDEIQVTSRCYGNFLDAVENLKERLKAAEKASEG